MIYGIAGASGTGKTTLAKAVAEKLGIPFVSASITELARECGFDAIMSLTLSERLSLQVAMMEKFVLRIQAIKGDAIIDRTPIDMIGYMLAEVYMHSHEDLTSDELMAVNNYVKLCQRAAARYFGHIWLTSPLGFYEPAPTRPPLNPAYQTHIHMLMAGALHTAKSPIKYSVLLTTDAAVRLSLVADAISSQFAARAMEERKTAIIH